MIKQKSAKSRMRETFARSFESVTNPNKIKSGGMRVHAKCVNYYIVGAGTVLDIAGTHLDYPTLGSVDQDRKIIQQDFWAVGDDMKSVLRSQLAHLKR